MRHNKYTAEWLTMVGAILMIVAIVLLVFFFTKGKTVITNETNDVESTSSISCGIDGLDYPFFTYNNSISQKTTVKAIFDNDGLLDTIALTHTLYYDDASLLQKSENENHASTDVAFERNGLKPITLSPKFSKLSDGIKMSLYASQDKIARSTLKFFLLDELESHNEYRLDDVYVVYVGKGFECIKNTTSNN